MRTLSLTKLDEKTFQIDISESKEILSNGKSFLEKMKIYSTKTDLSNLVEKMYTLGIDASETQYAVQCFTDLDHTKASFGFLGSFVNSWNHNEFLVGNC